jgi:hypothetical protein
MLELGSISDRLFWQPVVFHHVAAIVGSGETCMGLTPNHQLKNWAIMQASKRYALLLGTAMIVWASPWQMMHARVMIGH